MQKCVNQMKKTETKKERDIWCKIWERKSYKDTTSALLKYIRSTFGLDSTLENLRSSTLCTKHRTKDTVLALVIDWCYFGRNNDRYAAGGG